MISVALTTYNGMKYIYEQLESIKNQDLKPDEVIVIDDCSTDGTFEYVQNYIKENKLYNWVASKNSVNQGWQRNFRIALKKCQGDLIFLCDQDDIWLENKVSEMKVVMDNNEKIMLIASNYSIINIDRKGNLKPRGLYKDNKSVRPILFKSNSFTVVRPGCSYCLKKNLVDKLLEKDLPGEPHDLMLWHYALIYDGLYLFNRITMKYRCHSDSASAPQMPISKELRYKEFEVQINQLNFFAETCEENNMESKAKTIKERILFLRERTAILKESSLIKAVIFQMKNYMHYPTVRNMLSDYYLILFSK